MSVIFLLVPLAVLLAIGAVIGFGWAVRGGQFDDLDTPATRILEEDHESSAGKKQERSPAARSGKPTDETHPS